MTGYIVRRTLQMVPTVGGVILITFVLFNVVGGSPAAMTLGKHVSPQLLEEFDEQRGFNKPLIWGWWAVTRAHPDAFFPEDPGLWRDHLADVGRGAEDAGYLAVGPGELRIPLAFSLRPGTRYRWIMEFGHPPRSRIGLIMRNAVPQGVSSAEPGSTGQLVRLAVRGRKTVVDFTVTGKDPSFVLRIEGRESLRSIRLRRRMPHPWDSQLFFYLRQLCPVIFLRERDESGRGGVRLKWKGIDLGYSYSTNQRVSRMLLDGLVPSLTLTIPIFIGGLICGVLAALLCAYFRDTMLDRLFVVLSVALMSINYLVWIVGGQYLLGYRLGWFPVWGYESWSYLLLPVIIGILRGLGADIRFYRTVMLDEMYRDYVRTAEAKGVSRPGILFRHVLKNAMIPIITTTVIAIPFLYTGSLLLESFFGIPGLGYMGVNAINSSDVDVVRALVLIGSVMYVLANLLTDVCYALVDPRVRLR
ncbi:MAG TPA: ABC transporter permease [Kiritimatiellae bacterium]|nr:ABC transporter permease [Kiritimatiellia bacterium]